MSSTAAKIDCAALEHIFVFGDSYSSVGYGQGFPEPSKEQPFGIPFPGTTYAGDGKANWIGHLISKYLSSTPVVYNYAVGGKTVDGVVNQVSNQFLTKGPGDEYSAVHWDTEKSLFVTWVGFNDIAFSSVDVPKSLGTMFQVQEALYEAGARQFLLLNVAPIPPRSSKASGAIFADREERCQSWNAKLGEGISAFSEHHQDATMLLFDAYSLFSRMLADPVAYGFPAGSGHMYDQELYVDNIHPTSRVHQIVAKEVASFLTGEEIELDRPDRYEITVLDYNWMLKHRQATASEPTTAPQFADAQNSSAKRRFLTAFRDIFKFRGKP